MREMYFLCKNIIISAIIYTFIGMNSAMNRSTVPSKQNIKFHPAHPKSMTAPYRIKNRFIPKAMKFTPQKHYHYCRDGYASYYGNREHGRTTASGRKFNRNAMTAAHRSLPLPCVVRVTNLENQQSVLLIVNDRGPYPDKTRLKGRIIDVSVAAAKKLGFFGRKGIAKVRVEALPDASMMLKHKFIT